MTSQFSQESQSKFFPDSRFRNNEKEIKERGTCVFQKADPLKMENQSLFPLTFSSGAYMQINLDAKLSEEIVTLEAVLDHLRVSEWPFPILNGLNIL